jgi:glycosyltransferase involved in cell wall biosynthesis
LGDRLRLLHVIHTLDPAGGGAVMAARSMCAALGGRGHQVTLLAAGPERRSEAGIYRTEVFPMEFAPMALSLGLARAMKECADVDLVHIHMLYRFPQAAAAAFARWHAIAYCVQPHGALEPVLFHKPERRLAKRLYERAVELPNLRRAAGLIYTAPGERDAVDFLHLPAPAYIVPNGVALADFPANELTEGFRARHGLEDSELVVWMGRLVPVKGLGILCRAFAVIAQDRPKAMLALVGPDSEGHGAALKRMIGELGIAGRVIFTGLLEGADKLCALAAADLFVLPSYTENFGLAAVEAMAMSRPVIVSTGVKIAEEIAQAGAGRVVPPQAPALAAAIGALLDDAPARRRMAVAARTLAGRHDWSIVIPRLEAAYGAMIAAGGAKR